MYKNIKIIVNPVAGKDEAILSFIAEAFKDSGIHWDVLVTKKEGDARAFAEGLVHSGTEVVCVYGGDGTVCQVAQALALKDIPMFVLPGGTANVVAKELKMPIDSKAALDLIRTGALTEKRMDIGMCDDDYFLLRINVGFVADMVSKADPNLKAAIGQIAYGVTAISHILQSEPQKYSLLIDGEKKEVEGVAVMIGNIGNIGLPDVSIVPESDSSDGKLDVIVLHRGDIPSVMKAAGSALMQQKAEDVYTHWQAKEVSLTIPANQTVMCDDLEIATKNINAKIIPHALRILVPNA
jgi:diacylglycerol kinase (ATP)